MTSDERRRLTVKTWIRYGSDYSKDLSLALFVAGLVEPWLTKQPFSLTNFGYMFLGFTVLFAGLLAAPHGESDAGL